MAEAVRVRRLTDQEGRRLQQIMRRGSTSSVRCRAKQNRPDRIPATYHRTHEVTYFHGCYPIGDDTLRGVNAVHRPPSGVQRKVMSGSLSMFRSPSLVSRTVKPWSS